MNPADANGRSPERDALVPHPLDWLERTGTADALLNELASRRRRRIRRRRVLASATAAALVVAAGVFWRDGARFPAVPGRATRPAVVSAPEQRVLPDGSVVDLKSGARIAIDYRIGLRRIVLERGEAHFQVEKNETSPFVVVARGIAVRAVGTAFAVDAESAAVEVLVTSGEVLVEVGDGFDAAGAADSAQAAGERRKETGNDATDRRVQGTAEGAAKAGRVLIPSHVHSLSPIIPPLHPPVYVSAGKRVVLDATLRAGPSVTPRVTPVSEAEMSARLAWRSPRIEFSGTALAEAITMFNRYSRVRLVLGDALDEVHVSGILRGDNVDALVRLLEANYGVVAERREGEIVLRKRGRGK